MPTGYTAIIEENPNTTFEQYALRCARAFGACINMRDEPLDTPPPDEIKVDTYHHEQLLKAEARVRELETMTLPVAKRESDKQFADAYATWEECSAKRKQENATYDAMLAKVDAWKPPTPAHQELKSFMRQQIEISKSDYDWPAPEKLTAKQWLDDARKRAHENVEYHRERWKLAQESAKGRTKWLRDLRASLSNGDVPGK